MGSSPSPSKRIIQAFIASPGDLAEERRAFKEAIDELNKGIGRMVDIEFVSLGWEDTLSQVGRRAQSVINQDVDACDVFVLLMWRRWGQEAPDAAPYTSYTEEEFYRALTRFEKDGSPEILVFFKHIDPAQLTDPGPQLAKVLAFRKNLSHQVLYRGFKTVEEFKQVISSHLIEYSREKLVEEAQDQIRRVSVEIQNKENGSPPERVQPTQEPVGTAYNQAASQLKTSTPSVRDELYTLTNSLFPPPLLEAFRSNKLALFVGAGLSLSRGVKGNFPTWQQLPQRFLDACARFHVLDNASIQSKRDLFNRPMHSKVMLAELSTLSTALGHYYQRALNDIFRPADASPGFLHFAIAQLGVGAILTTNYDLLIEEMQETPRRHVYTWKEADLALNDLESGRRVLLKIHGTAERHDTVILTEREYDRSRSDAVYQAVMRYLLEEYTFLFLGYSIDAPLSFGLVLKWYADTFNATAHHHYVLLKDPSITESERYLSDYNIQVIPYHDHAELPIILQNLDAARRVPAQDREIATTAQKQRIPLAIDLSEAAPQISASPNRAPTPLYPNKETQLLSIQLDNARERKKALQSAGASTASIDSEILSLRRQLREGGQIHAGDSLDDGRFLLIEHIGQGGFANIWKAYDRVAQTVVAIKILHASLAGNKEKRERFFRGADRMAQLKHPAVVRVIKQHGEDGGYYYFAMEYLSGGNLRQAVLKKSVTSDKVISFILRIGEALALAHSNGIIHRDVKPANILLDESGRPLLTDFDLVGAADTTGGTKSGAMGTFLYAAPECMARPQDADARSDVYSLGMTAIFGLYGNDLPLQIMRSPKSFINRLQCSKQLKTVLSRAISLDPHDRYTNVAEFMEAMRRASHDTPLSGDHSDGSPSPNEQISDARRKLRLTVHRAFFLSTGQECFFINATNLSRNREIAITHIWIDTHHQIHVRQLERPLPKRLKPDEPWETWIEVDRVPQSLHERIYTLVRARLSTGQIIRSKRNKNVPQEGTVPGGPIKTPALDDESSSHLGQFFAGTKVKDRGKEVFVSYAWGGESEKIVDALEEALIEHGVTLQRDKNEIDYKGSIREFMQRIGRGKCVVIVLSRKYIESPNCMFEITEIATHEGFRDRVFPIVLPDAGIFDVLKTLDYVKYWEERIKELDAKMKEVELTNLEGIQERINLYRLIRSTVARITDVLRDMNARTVESHLASGFREVITAIEKRLGE